MENKRYKRWIERGKRWVQRYLHSELFHYGIKGQKWGVRNGPPYPLDKSKKGGIIEEAIRSGKVKKTINKDLQKRHNLSTHIKGRSYLYGDMNFAQKLVDELSGTGEALLDGKGQWLHKEKVLSSVIVGVHVDQKTGVETKTKAAMIIYSKTGTHVYPRKENDK